MDIKTALDIIIEDLDDVQKLIGNLKQIREVPRLDIEMSLSKCRNIKEIMQLIQQLELYAPELEDTGKNTVVKTEGKEVEPTEYIVDKKEHTEAETEKKEQINEEMSVEAEKKEEEKEEKKAGQQTKETPDKLADTAQEEQEKGQKPEETGRRVGQKKQNGPRVIGERFSPQRGRNESLAGEMPKIDLTSKLMEKPIRDIPFAIGINDRYTYIRELFEGNTEEYNKTIEYLNNLTSWEDALRYINDHFDWDYESEVSRQFLITVKRKLFVYE
jgi:hypothetical protein